VDSDQLVVQTELSLCSHVSSPPGWRLAMQVVIGRTKTSHSRGSNRRSAEGVRCHGMVQGVCGTEAGSYLRRIDSCITQLKARGPSRTCNESKEEEVQGGAHQRRCGGRSACPGVQAPPSPPPHAREHSPGGNPGANLTSISHRCHPILVAFVWELSQETIDLPLGCLQGGS